MRRCDYAGDPMGRHHRRIAAGFVESGYDALALTAIDCAAFSYHGEDLNSARRMGRGGFVFIAFLRGELTVLRLIFFDALWFKFVS